MTTGRKVQFFEADNIWKLEDRVNKFLNKQESYNIVDIKYNHINGHKPESSEEYESWNMVYTAMVIYTPGPERDTVPDRIVPAPVPDGGIEGL